ncbi:TBC1 domain protein [Tritrichomonas foetus]|uniref:TBC1 domain protein n=1 Tax=Tritrichomonas foetus TaxID=1144522 RepID=A0A1J4KI89_9EUKA|nr:TBC1 domain protein [Tritrichomonas foetus]|eukprot:OHT10648.1 TBC1 domain protein [Tritrichomonas foetus]
MRQAIYKLKYQICRQRKILAKMKNASLSFKILPLTITDSDKTPVDVEAIRKICIKGLDDCPPEDRCIAWLVLSGVFPSRPGNWNQYRGKMVASYQNFTKMFHVENYIEKVFPNTTNSYKFGFDSNEDNERMVLIHADIVRTVHHIIFLPSPDHSVEDSKIPKDPLLPFHFHMRRIERILYIFSKMNQSLLYLQGFNELICVIYYVMSSSLMYFGNDWLEVEAFSFYIFQNIFSCTQISDLFTMQDKLSLIHERMDTFMFYIKRHVPKAYKIITDLGIDPLCFGFKWLNLLFAQNHLMPNLVLIWDALFGHFNDMLDFGYYIGTANIAMIEGSLLPQNYARTLTILQRTEINDVKELLRLANKFWNDDHRY